MNKDQFEKFLEAALKRHTKAPPSDDAVIEHILKRIEGPLPRQKPHLWRLPNVLLDWQFAPAWPRVAALACCAAIGFVIGIAGVDRHFDRADPRMTVASSSDLGAIVFEPEAMTGARP